MLKQLRQSARNSGGFTAIELVIAMALGGIVLAGLGTLAIGGFANTQKTQAERTAVEQANNASSIFRDDISRAKASGRDEDILTNTPELTSALLSAEPVVRNSVTVDVADVLYASGQELWIRGDRIGGQETCIRYYLDVATGTPQVLRDVIPYIAPIAGGGTGRIVPLAGNSRDTARGGCNTAAVPFDRQVVVERL